MIAAITSIGPRSSKLTSNRTIRPASGNIMRKAASRTLRPSCARSTSHFNPNATPEKTQAFWEFVDASRAPENAEMVDVLDALDNPEAIYPTKIVRCAELMTPSDKKNKDGQP